MNNKKQKEALVLAMLEKGESYRSIAQKAKCSPNTIKMLANRAGLDETTSISSRAFELYSQQSVPSPLIVAIQLGLKSEEALRYHQEYFMLLGCTEFTKAYLQVKDNPWPFISLVKLSQNSGISDSEVLELLKIANGYLPRIRLECGRFKEEMSSLQAEINSWRTELNNIARLYQQFVDRNIELKNREDGLQLNVDKLEAHESELQTTITRLEQQLSVLDMLVLIIFSILLAVAKTHVLINASLFPIYLAIFSSVNRYKEYFDENDPHIISIRIREVYYAVREYQRRNTPINSATSELERYRISLPDRSMVACIDPGNLGWLDADSHFNVEDLFRLEKLPFIVEIVVAKARKEDSKIRIKNKEGLLYMLTDREAYSRY
jgi:hypothetical protein